VSGELKVMPLGKSFLRGLNRLGVYFYKAAALDTNQMVMVAVSIIMLIANDALSKINCPRQTRIANELQGPVHRGYAYAGMFILHQLGELCGRDMPLAAKKGVHDKLTRCAVLDTMRFKVVGKVLVGRYHYQGPIK
jgi:hypothetical protein